MSSDALADDELLALFAADEDAEDESAVDSDSALRFASAQPLSADEFDELLRAIESGEQSPPPQEQDREQRPQRARNARQTPVTPGGKAAAASLQRKKVPSKLSNKARDGRREELVYLRKTVLGLETQLRKLLNGNGGQGRITMGAPAPGVSPSLVIFEQQQQQLSSNDLYKPTGMQPSSELQLHTAESSSGQSDLWKEVVRHQRMERDRSERENIRLRLVLESQLKVAKSLEKFLMTKASTTTSEIGKCIDPQRYNQMTHYSDLSGRERDAAIYQDLLIGVEQMLAEVDAVYEANGLARVETTQISAQTRFDAQQGAMCVELCASKALPFDVHETGAAVWNHYIYAKQRMPSRFYTYHSLKSIDATEDTIIEDFLLELHTKNTRGNFHLRQVSRRLVEEDRVVIVWRTYSDPLEFSEQPLSGLRALEKGYIVIRKSASGDSLLQPCHIMYPCVTLEGDDAILGDGTGNTVVGALTDFMLSADSEFVTHTNQMVENVLLEQALKKSSGAVQRYAVAS
ncbi:hypothetical protein Gpo141_00008203 [Globisporangium polare]